MVICHICSYYDNVLYNNLIQSQKRDIKNIQHFVYYFWPKDREEAPNSQYEYVKLRRPYKSYERAVFAVKHKKVLDDFVNFVKKDDFDMMYAHSLFSNGYIAYKAKERWGKPYVVMVQNTDMNVFFKYMIHLRGLGRKILNNADHIIVASQVYKDELLEKYVKKKDRKEIEERISVIPYGISDVFFDDFAPETQLKQSTHTGDTNKAINLLTVGLVDKNKNNISVCKAIELLQRRGYKVRYTIIGRTGNAKVIDRLRQFDFVEYIPYMSQEKLIEHYRSADIFVLTSIHETFGLVYAEALSQGVPIVYTKGQGFDKQFKEGEVGYHVEAKNCVEIADAIEKVFESIENIKPCCIDKSQKFKWRNVNKLYVPLYENVLHGKIV